MIILDTNVVSDPMKPNGSQTVQDWLDRQAAETLYLCAISLSELLTGIENLPHGKRKDGLAAGLDALLGNLFGPRILPFDRQAALVHASLLGRMRAGGKAISLADGQIAATALVHGFSVATRDTAPFAAAGLNVINPWEA